MRLVCPNCGAQYEVDDRVIPESGRDVQCSACGHAWYQMAAEDEGDALAEAPSVDEALTDDETADDETAGADTGDTEPGEIEPEASEPQDAAAPEAKTPPQPRGIDDGVRSILKEEAERELDARSREPSQAADPVETQPDLGLDAGPSPDDERRRVARERLARMRGMEAEEPAEAAFDANAEPGAEDTGPAAHGRDLFPDIEEINSTLDRHGQGADSAPAGAGPAAKAPGGFRRGFTSVLFIAILLLTLYILAPRFAENIPALKPALTTYVDTINIARDWLELMLRGVVDKIEAITGDG